MYLLKLVGDAFIQYTCDCCGRTFVGVAQYRAGLLQCQPCARGEHRHQMRKAA